MPVILFQIDLLPVPPKLITCQKLETLPKPYKHFQSLVLRTYLETGRHNTFT
jgi:hypothetical protein